jgi:Transcriptional regulators
MKDVAKLAGVSVATVSNVLTGKKPVSDELTQKVMDVINEVDYKVDLIARGLKSKQTYNIGVVMLEISMLFFPEVLSGIEDAARKYGYTLTYYSSRYSFETEKDYINQLISMRSDGLLLDSCCPIDQQKVWAKELSRMNTSNIKIPVVCMDRVLDSSVLPTVCVNNEEIGMDATKRLIELGRKRILHIAAPLDLSVGRLRYEGYKKALSEAGIAFDQRYVLEGDYSSGTAYSLMKEVLSSNLTFDGLFAGNDQMAIGALKALLEEGIKIPEQVAIIGFDNVFPGTLVNPSISTYNVPKYRMGYEAFEMLYRKMVDPQRPVENIVFEANYIERQSTNILSGGGWDLGRW